MQYFTMVCTHYTGYTWSILLGMILTGSARSILVKLAYQSGLRAPLTVTLLYLFGQSLSLFVYWFQSRVVATDYDAVSTAKEDEHEQSVELPALPPEKQNVVADVDIDTPAPKAKQENDTTITALDSATTESISMPSRSSSLSSTDSASLPSAMFEFYTSVLASFNADEIPNGSNHGLSVESEERIKWVHLVPWYAKPAIPALFNLLNSAFRWASLVYIDASVAEMMISGLELTLSVIAARVFRKRMVAKSRWLGIIVVAFGVIIIERANNSKHNKQSDSDAAEKGGGDKVHGTRDVMIGVVLIVLQSVLSVLQDIMEEIFMQAADFPATKMLGMEGLYGFCTGAVIYTTLGTHLRIEDIDATMSLLRANPMLRWWLVGLPALFLVTGIFNIKATEVTSAMTRNVWKNFRTVLIWAVALCIFYVGGDAAYGEAWHVPESFFILMGFSVMFAGVVVYYSK